MEDNTKIRDGLYYLRPISFVEKTILSSGIYYVENDNKFPALITTMLSEGGTIGLGCFFFDYSSGLMEAGTGYSRVHLEIERPMIHADLKKIAAHYQELIRSLQSGILPDGYSESDLTLLIKDRENALRKMESLERYLSK
jgi:hypothetical protein